MSYLTNQITSRSALNASATRNVIANTFGKAIDGQKETAEQIEEKIIASCKGGDKRVITHKAIIEASSAYDPAKNGFPVREEYTRAEIKELAKTIAQNQQKDAASKIGKSKVETSPVEGEDLENLCNPHPDDWKENKDNKSKPVKKTEVRNPKLGYDPICDTKDAFLFSECN